MSVYIGSNLEDSLKTLETECASLKNTMNTITLYMKSIICQTYMQTMVFIRNQ